MDNKELPQEVVNEITLADCQKQVAVKYGLGTTLVTGHKAAYFNEATDMLVQAKDTTIKEQAEKIEKLTELAINEYLNRMLPITATAQMRKEYINKFKEQHGI